MPDTQSGFDSDQRVTWEFPGWGTAERIDDLNGEPVVVTHLDSGVIHKLGEWRSTAICGNDITSSCLYVAALSALYAGPYAPIALATVAAILYLFRNIYAEVGTALPLNGGAYNVLLNTSTKAKASVAACLTLLSYIATAVISANEAMHYAHNLWNGLNIFWATVILLGLFAVLNLIGISESSVVALALFITHMLTLAVLVISSAIVVSGDVSTFIANWHTPAPGGLFKAVFSVFLRRCWESADLRVLPISLKNKRKAYFQRLYATCGSRWLFSIR